MHFAWKAGPAARYEVTGPRVIAAVLAGAALGGATVAAPYLWGMYRQFGTGYLLEFGPRNGAVVFVVAFTVWLAGIALLGGIVWHMLHRLGWRQPWVAAGIGALLPLGVNYALNTGMFTGRTSGNFSYFAHGGQIWENSVLTAFGWQLALEGALTEGLYGIIIGLLIWRVAYRRG